MRLYIRWVNKYERERKEEREREREIRFENEQHRFEHLFRAVSRMKEKRVFLGSLASPDKLHHAVIRRRLMFHDTANRISR